jgi:hypothetical protein
MRAGRSVAGMVRVHWCVAYVDRWRQVVANQGVCGAEVRLAREGRVHVCNVCAASACTHGRCVSERSLDVVGGMWGAGNGVDMRYRLR